MGFVGLDRERLHINYSFHTKYRPDVEGKTSFTVRGDLGIAAVRPLYLLPISRAYRLSPLTAFSV